MRERYIPLTVILTVIFASLNINVGISPMRYREAKIRAKYESIEAYEKDRDLLAEVMYWENYDNGTEAMAYTAGVVLNRARYCTWCPDTIHGVVYQKGQYSTTKKLYTRDIPEECYYIAEDLIVYGTSLPPNVIYQAMFKQGKGTYKKVGTDYFCYGYDSEINLKKGEK